MEKQKANLDALSEAYGKWLDEQGLPHEDAMELIHGELNAYQRQWLSNFILEWEEAEGENA